jgi:hypothetical protein
MIGGSASSLQGWCFLFSQAENCHGNESEIEQGILTSFTLVGSSSKSATRFERAGVVVGLISQFVNGRMSDQFAWI